MNTKIKTDVKTLKQAIEKEKAELIRLKNLSIDKNYNRLYVQALHSAIIQHQQRINWYEELLKYRQAFGPIPVQEVI